MAMTAWSAKVVTSSICLPVNGLTLSPRQVDHADHRVPAQQRHAEHGSLLSLGLRLEPGELGVFEQVGNVHGPAFERGPADYRSPPGNDGVLRHVPYELLSASLRRRT